MQQLNSKDLEALQELLADKVITLLVEKQRSNVDYLTSVIPVTDADRIASARLVGQLQLIDELFSLRSNRVN